MPWITYLHNAIASEFSIVIASEWHSINDVSELVITRSLAQSVVELFQRFPRTSFLADLEELDTNLPCWRVEFIKLLGRCNDGSFDVV